jgi:hypothetical protein
LGFQEAMGRNSNAELGRMPKKHAATIGCAAKYNYVFDSKGLKISLSLVQRYRKIHTKKDKLRFF